MVDVFEWETVSGKGLFVAGMCEIWGELVRDGQGEGVFLQGQVFLIFRRS